MKPTDLSVVLNGLEAVAKAFIKINSNELDKFWRNSTVQTITKSVATSAEETLSSIITSSGGKNPVLHMANEVKERSSVVTESIKQYTVYLANQRRLSPESEFTSDFDIKHPVIQESETFMPKFEKDNVDSLYQKSLSPNSGSKDTMQKSFTNNQLSSKGDSDFVKIVNTKTLYPSESIIYEDINITKAETDISEKDNIIPTVEVTNVANQWKSQNTHSLQKLNERARERKVPVSSISRLFSYGELAVGMSLGAVAEVARRNLGLKSDKDSEHSLLSRNPFLTEQNANRIVDTLCKVRGAALKLGQMLSIQDNSMINPQLAAVFERVRQSADFMPTWQMERVLVNELGSEWRNLFTEFDPKPFAAASIGQVHCAKLPDGTEVALKIQYPGVAEGIENDIKSLKAIMNFGNIIPKGFYLDNVLTVAQRELKKEVDYIHEAQSAKRFKELLELFPQFYVPDVYDNLCTRNVLTTKLVTGKPVDKIQDANQELKNEVCKNLLHLCLMEVFHFRFMQTDPNWSNFLYNFDTEKIILLDFGACNEYSSEFVDTYMCIIKAAAEQDRDNVLRFSQELGFLCGYENKEMEKAHVDAVMILGEAFASKKPFDFKRQSTSHRIHELVPIMLKHRLTPPPEETYSLHRKLSGIFLLCTKLGAVVDCSKLFDEVYNEYCARKKR